MIPVPEHLYYLDLVKAKEPFEFTVVFKSRIEYIGEIFDEIVKIKKAARRCRNNAIRTVGFNIAQEHLMRQIRGSVTMGKTFLKECIELMVSSFQESGNELIKLVDVARAKGNTATLLADMCDAWIESANLPVDPA